MKKAMVYLQSGGPTSVINCSLLGAVEEAKKHPNEIDRIYGSHYGVEGLLNDDLIDLTDLSNEKLSLLRQTPGAILGSSRHKLVEGEEETILKTLLKHNIGYVFVNGGNDSMDTCDKLGNYFAKKGIDIRVNGIPKTMDNDLVNTDHTPGFGSAAKYIINTVKSLVIDASCYRKGKIILVEVMGRDSGWNAACTDILEAPYRPDYIYFRENHFDYQTYLKEITETYRQKGYCLCVVSEGIEVPHTNATAVDGFGHQILDGATIELAKQTKEDTGLSVRSISLSIPTRCSPLFTSGVDQKEAYEVGAYAVIRALEGETKMMVSLLRDSSNPYHIHYGLTPVSDVANGIKLIPQEFVVDHTRLSDSFREYMRPLIQNEPAIIKQTDGIIDSLSL